MQDICFGIAAVVHSLNNLSFYRAYKPCQESHHAFLVRSLNAIWTNGFFNDYAKSQFEHVIYVNNFLKM